MNIRNEEKVPWDNGGAGMEARSGRRSPRYPLAVDVELTNLESGIQIKERTKDLSLYGCGVSTVSPFSAGIKVMLKVVYRGKEIVAFGRVIYGRQDIGMGIAFTSIAPEDQKLLEDWFAEQPHLQHEDDFGQR
jgi:hypothetical protein